MNGVTFTSIKKLTYISVSHETQTHQTLTGESIIFSDKDADKLNIPHNDALVITLKFFYTDVRMVLIFPDRLSNIVQLVQLSALRAVS